MGNTAKWVKHTYHSRFLRVAFVGGLGFLVQTIIFELLTFYFHVATPSTATLIGGECGLLANFYLNERISFSDRVAHAGSHVPRLLRFHGVVAISLLIQWAVLFEIEHSTSNILYIHIAYVTGLILGFVTNYSGYKYIVWRGIK